MVLIEVGDEPHRILYTGDFCCHDQPVLDGATMPVTGEDFPIDTLIIEGVLATNREADAVDIGAEWDRFTAYAGTDEPTLVGVSAVGESVEVAGALSSTSTEVVADLSLEIVFENYAGAPSVTFADGDGLAAALERGATVLAPGDQFEAGSTARTLAARVVGLDDGRLAVLNRVYGRSFADDLLDAQPGDALRVYPDKSATIDLRAEVEHFTLPNHAPRWQLVATVEAIGAERTVLVHGRESQLQALRRAIGDGGYDGDVLVPANGDGVCASKYVRR